ncbi:hypothetical protein OIV83_003938 [Microbotryomycetes sp. JL201]|nr:hypothetical protein OIV83_003938 [Microbotryomycetes sp. JL201]
MSSELHGVALLGAGIFAKTSHLPAIVAADGFKLLAVYSRSQQSAQELADAAKQYPKLAAGIDLYADNPGTNGGLDALLKRDDVKTVILALPIMVQPAIIKRAWQAGKNVISEKPVAPTVGAARELIQMYESEYKPKGLTWIVAEQFPYSPLLNKARDLIAAGKIGTPLSFDFTSFHYIPAQSQYHATSWRTNPEHQGGFILDGGVHFTAGLRHILPHPITHVTATTALVSEHLPPVDTCNALFETSEPTLKGTMTLSVGIPGTSKAMYTVRGTRGILEASFRGQITIQTLPDGVEHANPGQRPNEITVEAPFPAVNQEFEAFSEALTEGIDSESWTMVQQRSGPRATLRDLAIIEAALKSGDNDSVKVDLKELEGQDLWDI